MENAVTKTEATQVVASAQATSLLQAITQAASNPATDIEKMERLFKMHQVMVSQEAEAAFNAAMSRAQSNIVPVANNADNKQTNSRYAKLAQINKEITPIYTAEGLSISFDTADVPGRTDLQRTIAIVSHSQGHSRQYHMDLPLDDAGAQGKVNKTKVHATASSNSYARRYLVCMIFNVTTEDDDDGNGAGGSQGLPDEEFTAFLKEIEAQTSKAKAKGVWERAVKACAAVDDVDSANRLKAVLIEHGKFIDAAAAKEAA